jgi:hypothetical protein
MEDWATFGTTLLPYVLSAEEVPQCVRDLCAPLHRVVTFFCRYTLGQTAACQLVEASKAALEFAAKAEAAFRRAALATHQLHVVPVHLALVAAEWGPTAFLCEYWIERLMQVRVHPGTECTRSVNVMSRLVCLACTHVKARHSLYTVCKRSQAPFTPLCVDSQDFKRCVKLRCTRHPELTAFLFYLYDMALLQCKRLYPDVDRGVTSKYQTPVTFDKDGLACELAGVTPLSGADKEVRTGCVELVDMKSFGAPLCHSARLSPRHVQHIVSCLRASEMCSVWGLIAFERTGERRCNF